MRTDTPLRDIGFVVFDISGRIADANQAACERLQYTAAELKQLGLPAIAPGLDPGELLGLLDQSPDRWVQWSGLLQARTGDGLSVKARVVQLLGADASMFVAIFPLSRLGEIDGADSTVDTMWRWADDLAHRLNNFLTIVQVHASYLIAEEKLGSDASESVREIYLAVNRAAELTAQLATMHQRFSAE